ncbi:MAG: hypothetical protein O2U61_07625, partial [Candidatus Bathyarchaeota archaeon]|nr:hypothetical protein [Candidatus Bathyarchaeota archaeon]
TLEGEVPIGGYGVHFNYVSYESWCPAEEQKDKYTIFADKESVNSIGGGCFNNIANQRFDADPFFTCFGGEICGDVVIPGGDYHLQDGVEIYRIRFEGDDPTVHRRILDIAFKSPRPIPYVGEIISDVARDSTNANHDSKSGKTVLIYLKLKDKDVCRKVTVFSSTGRVKEEGVNWNECAGT